MAYTPFKMQGHELPGPNQRTPLTNQQRRVGVNRYTEGMGRAMGGRTAEASYGAEGRRRDEFFEEFKEWAAPIDQQNAPIDQPNTPVDQPNNQLSTDTTDFSASGATGDATKKKVDVEVTVNGQPV